MWAVAFIFGLGGMFALVGIGVPIAFALGFVGFAGLSLFASPDLAISMMSLVSVGATTHYTMAAVPIFVLTAHLLVASGIAERAYSGVFKALAGVPGSLALGTTAAGALLGAIIGASAATTATLSHVGMGEMRRHGYHKVLTAGAIAGAGGLAVVIPPSVPAIVYAFVNDVSVLAMFAAGIIPGIIMAIGYGIWVVVIIRIRPDMAPRTSGIDLAQRVRSTVHVLPVLLLVIVVLGSVFTGLASVAESAAFGALTAFLLSILYRKGSWGKYLTSLKETASTAGFVMMIVVGAFYFSQFWIFTGVTTQLGLFLLSLPVSAIGLLLLSNVFLLLLGCVMDTLAMNIVIIPIIVYALVAAGMDPIWLGLIFLINMETSLITPPIGMNIYVVTGLGGPYGIRFEDVAKGIVPYVAVNALVIIIVMLFPEIALWLPRMLAGYRP